MILKIGAAVIDGSFPDTNGYLPVQEFNTDEGLIVVVRDTTIKKGLRVSVSVSLTQQEAVDLLEQYRDTQAIVPVDYADKIAGTAKNIGNAVIESVSLTALDQNAWAMLNMQTLNGVQIESIRSGSIGLIMV